MKQKNPVQDILLNARKNPDNDIQRRILYCIRPTTVEPETGEKKQTSEKNYYYLEMTQDMQDIILNNNAEIHDLFGKPSDDNSYYYLEPFESIPDNASDLSLIDLRGLAPFREGDIKKFNQNIIDYRKEMIEGLIEINDELNKLRRKFNESNESSKTFRFSTHELKDTELKKAQEDARLLSESFWRSVWRRYIYNLLDGEGELAILKRPGTILVLTLSLTTTAILAFNFWLILPIILSGLFVSIALEIACILIEAKDTSRLKSEAFDKYINSTAIDKPSKIQHPSEHKAENLANLSQELRANNPDHNTGPKNK